MIEPSGHRYEVAVTKNGEWFSSMTVFAPTALDACNTAEKAEKRLGNIGLEFCARLNDTIPFQGEPAPFEPHEEDRGV